MKIKRPEVPFRIGDSLARGIYCSSGFAITAIDDNKLWYTLSYHLLVLSYSQYYTVETQGRLWRAGNNCTFWTRILHDIYVTLYILNPQPVTNRRKCLPNLAHVHLHDDVMVWKRFAHYWPVVGEIHLSPVNFPHKRSAMRGDDVYIVVSLIRDDTMLIWLHCNAVKKYH